MDASGIGLGAVLSQPSKKGKPAPIPLISRKLQGSPNEKKKDERLAAYWAIVKPATSVTIPQVYGENRPQATAGVTKE